MKEYFFFCNNCFRVEHMAVGNNTYLNFDLRCGCGHYMCKTGRMT